MFAVKKKSSNFAAVEEVRVRNVSIVLFCFVSINRSGNSDLRKQPTTFGINR